MYRYVKYKYNLIYLYFLFAVWTQIYTVGYFIKKYTNIQWDDFIFVFLVLIKLLCCIILPFMQLPSS